MDPPQQPSWLSKVRKPSWDKRWWMIVASYAGDWLLTGLLTGLFFGLSTLDGFRRRFSLEDETIQFPYTEQERVPNWLLAILAFVVPLVLMPLINLISIRSLYDLHNSELGLFLSLALAGSLTIILKLTAGRPRPDLIARCLPLPGSRNHPVFGLVDHSICTQTDDAILKDGWESFASAHAALSFAGLGFLTLYLAGKMHLFDHRGQTAKAWLSVLPLFGATVISITRTMDYRHHWEDIAVGMVIGSTIAYFSYRQYYPSLDHRLSHWPFAPRNVSTDHYRSAVIDNDTEGDGALSRSAKGKGRDLENGGGGSTRNVHESDLIDLGYAVDNNEGTVPRSSVPNLKRVWSEGSQHSRSGERTGSYGHASQRTE